MPLFLNSVVIMPGHSMILPSGHSIAKQPEDPGI